MGLEPRRTPATRPLSAYSTWESWTCVRWARAPIGKGQIAWPSGSLSEIGCAHWRTDVEFFKGLSMLAEWISEAAERPATGSSSAMIDQIEPAVGIVGPCRRRQSR